VSFTQGTSTGKVVLAYIVPTIVIIKKISLKKLS